MLEALTVLSPRCVEAWVALAALHNAQGRVEQAREAALEAALLGGTGVNALGGAVVANA